MARPKIGIFGALMALGGFLAVRYVQQRNRAAQVPVGRELNRWENEGGTVAAPTANQATTAGSASPSAHGANGSAYPNGNGGPWPFPRS
ncbi:hypothetical protein B0G71_3010 [Paraburkholderia sp. BL27I4N3]|uniref:hypothetical protein n=1 Tax=Paraburkholderia sp. BL27I4N3 TaxID=1938805 RepID=UPI000E25DC84|nr:hypothetical protein [Paraburkholderia sp. BL27I4N3]REE19893.1 hypothetical protein B0G71_3010 [Paraburkholderia sp. BL27I4N3]